MIPVQVGCRALYGGSPVLVVAPYPHGWKGSWWHVQPLRRWRPAARPAPGVVHEATLSNVVMPTFEPGEEVRVGAFGKKGVVVARIEGSNRYVVRFPEEIRTTRKGTQWRNEATESEVGVEHINIV